MGRLPALAAELVQLPVDVIVARGDAAIRAVQQATATIPIVMAVTADPVAQGFIANLGQPGKNTTGLSSMGADLSGKQLEIIKETVPMVSRIAVLANPDNPGSPYLLHDVQVAAHALQVQLHVLAVQSRADLERAFAAIQHEEIGAFLILSDPLRLDQFRHDIVAFALQHRLPAVYPWRMIQRPAASCLMGPASPICTTVQPPMWIVSSKAPSQPISLWSSPPSSSWSSTSRPPRRSGSRCPPRSIEKVG